MQILFSHNSTPLSKMIRAMTHEPVSHCAIKVNNWVVHSTIFGPEIRTYQDFCKRNTIVYTVDTDIDVDRVVELITATDHKFYDYPGLLYLGLRYACRQWLGVPLPKANLWNVSGMYLCTELVTKLVFDKVDSMITPYGLYTKLCLHELPRR